MTPYVTRFADISLLAALSHFPLPSVITSPPTSGQTLKTLLILPPKDASLTATTTQYCWYETTPQPAAPSLMIPSASTCFC